MGKVVIVGGVAGGASAAARLRRLDEAAEIILFERGEYISYANCGLPYYIGGEIRDKDALIVQTPENFSALLRVDVRLYQDVTEIDKEKKTVTVKDTRTDATYQESYDTLVLSPGAVPLVPPIEGAGLPKVFTLRNVPDTYKIKDYIDREKPKDAVVLGGGYIGVEMAENLKNAGLNVTIVEMTDQVIAPLDYDMACDVHRHIAQKGVRLLLKDAVKAIREVEGRLSIELNQGEIATDMLIMSAGVRPENQLAKAAGLAINERGFIVVDEAMRTSDPDIYAAGDVVEITDFVTGQKGSIPLGGPANKQGRVIADNICGLGSTYSGTQGSAILRVFDMTVATTGINEKTAKRLSLDYGKSFTNSPSHASYYPGAINMSIKIIYENTTGKILGAQVTGFDGVDKRCDVLATAIRAGMTAADLAKLELCYAPPYSSAKDPVNIAGFVIENLLAGLSKNFHWHDVDALPRDGSVTLIDTRTPVEFDLGHIDGFTNIPVDTLRERLSELDNGKKVYVACSVGQKGYFALRILAQHGFDVYNLSGGYRLYHSIYGEIQQPSSAPGAPGGKADADASAAGSKAAAAGSEPRATAQAAQAAQDAAATIEIDACGLQCPGPIVKLADAMKAAKDGDVIEIRATDPAFASDIEGYCRRTGHAFLSSTLDKGVSTTRIRKGEEAQGELIPANGGNGKNFIVFSGDLDKAIASFIMANASAALGRKVSMFFTFWGLNILRKPDKVAVQKDFMAKMFGAMMPRGSRKLGLSKMNMGGMGAKMIRSIMKTKNVDSLEDMILLAQKNGVELVACAMSMDVMGIKAEELIDGVKLGGAAAMLAHAEESDMSLFI
ncbi:MAG: FAD-dependent oxidoreductase [Clostridiales bacterium]|nr:FAD-dependent oxidoreductase [Clostridiales bacterium]